MSSIPTYIPAIIVLAGLVLIILSFVTIPNYTISDPRTVGIAGVILLVIGIVLWYGDKKWF